MKKLLTALVVTLSTAAMADQVGTTQAQQEQQRNEGRRVTTGVDASEVGPEIKHKAKEVRGDVKEAADDTRQATNEKAREVKQDANNTADRIANKAGLATASQGTFKKDKAFSANGTLKNTGGGGVTLVRPGLPDANLDVRQETIVMLDGKKVDSSAIPEGSAVRARFQLEGEEIVAVEINATSPKGVKVTKDAPATQPIQ